MMPYKPKTFRMVEQQPRQAAKDYDRKREKDKPWRKTYRNDRWTRARVTYLGHHPLCVDCQQHGKATAATDVDHIIPHRGDMELFWDVNNWQALCHSCHSKKTARGE